MNRYCHKCNTKLIEYSELILHPENECDISDGVNIDVVDLKAQEILKNITEPKKVENSDVQQPKSLKRLFTRLLSLKKRDDNDGSNS